jgi:CBS domain-containing protein
MADLKVRDVMTSQVVYLPGDTTLDQAAQAMRERDIGDVVVTEGPTLAGMVTDRDIVLRSVAEGQDPTRTALATVATRDLIMIEQDASTAEAADVMRERAVRRLLVCDSDRQLVGIVSLGDLAMAAEPSSTLSDISEAEPNN